MSSPSAKHVFFGTAGLALTILALLLIGMRSPAAAAPAAQFTPFPTPTPGPDGKIVYIAQDNDSAWRIAAIFNIPLEKLRTLNKWTGDVIVIRPGQEIILGYAGPAEATSAPGPTMEPTPSAPTPSSAPGWGDLCIILYNDRNGDSQRQEDESSILGGAISIANRAGTLSKTADTTGGLDYTCFEELPEGEYNISVAVPEGYNPITVMNKTIYLRAGDIPYVTFGAQVNTQKLAVEPPPQGGGKSPMLGIVGGLLLLAGIGLGLFAGRLAILQKRQ